MKILILANNDVGLYKFRKEFLSALCAKYSVTVALPMGEWVTAIRALGCDMIETPMERRGINPLKEVQLLRLYREILKREKPDIVLTYTIKPNLYGGLLCRVYQIPYFMTITGLGTAIHNGGILSYMLKKCYALVARKAKTVFFQNITNYEFFRTNRLFNDNAVIVSGSGVNLKDYPFEPYPSQEGRLKFLFVARIMKNKGVEEFLQCASYIRAKYSHTEFHVVGAYDEEKYRERIERLQSDGIIQYHGQQKDVRTFMKEAHAIIHPSYHEGLSNVLLEAAATGRPVLASNIPGCRETFDEGVSGFGFEPQNAQALIETVERFLALPYEEKERMGAEGRRKVETEFDRRRVVKAYMDEIERVEKERKISNV